MFLEFYIFCAGKTRGFLGGFLGIKKPGFYGDLGLFASIWEKNPVSGWVAGFWDRLLFTAEARSPLAPLKEGGDKIPIKVPLLKGDLGGSGLRYKREIKMYYRSSVYCRGQIPPSPP